MKPGSDLNSRVFNFFPTTKIKGIRHAHICLFSLVGMEDGHYPSVRVQITLLYLWRDLEDAGYTHYLLPLRPLNNLHGSSVLEGPLRPILRKLITGKLEDN